jgi:hypothetical protein
VSANLYPICPKCHYQRNEYDSLTHQALSPACGIIYKKWQSQKINQQKESKQDTLANERQTMSLYESVKNLLFTSPDSIDNLTFGARLLTFILFFIWGCSFILGGIDWPSIGGSFLHTVNLPFHEFGHILFYPFGRFWMILGGSLFQVLLPLVFLFTFLLKQRDIFAATIMLWWCGQNLIDVSPYILDAPLRTIPLIRGLDEEAHDWGNLLTMTNNLHNTEFIAHTSFNIGAFLLVLSFTWGAYNLWQQKKV